MALQSSRVVRTFGVLFAVIGAALIAVNRVLAVVADLANNLVGKAIARYSSFTGKMALENFPEDKALYAQVKSLQAGLLPVVNAAVPIVLVVAIVLIAIAVVCLAFPKQVAQVLVAIKIWKNVECETVSEITDEPVEKLETTTAKKTSFLSKKILASAGVFLVLVIVVIAFVSSGGVSAESVRSELLANSEMVVSELKASFNSSKTVGIVPKLESSEIFDYAPKKGGFKASLKQDVNGCPAGSVWKISSEVKGFFQKNLSIYRKAPTNSACEKLVPNFKDVGK